MNYERSITIKFINCPDLELGKFMTTLISGDALEISDSSGPIILVEYNSHEPSSIVITVEKD